MSSLHTCKIYWCHVLHGNPDGQHVWTWFTWIKQSYKAIDVIRLSYVRRIDLILSSNSPVVTWLNWLVSWLRTTSLNGQISYMREQEYDYSILGDPCGHGSVSFCSLEIDRRHGLIRAGLNAMSIQTYKSFSRLSLMSWKKKTRSVQRSQTKSFLSMIRSCNVWQLCLGTRKATSTVEYVRRLRRNFSSQRNAYSHSDYDADHEY